MPGSERADRTLSLHSLSLFISFFFSLFYPFPFVGARSSRPLPGDVVSLLGGDSARQSIRCRCSQRGLAPGGSPPEKLRGVFRPHSGCALRVRTDAARLPPGMRSEAADADAETGSRTRLEDQSRRRPGKDTGEREGTLRCDGGRTPEGAPSLGGQCAPSGGWPGPGPSPSGGRQVFASPGAWGRGRPLPESRRSPLCVSTTGLDTHGFLSSPPRPSKAGNSRFHFTDERLELVPRL